MKEQFVSISIAEVLKQKGFDEPCMAYVYTGDTSNNVDRYVYGPIIPEGIVVCDDWNKYDMTYSLPLWQQVIDWLRKKHRFIITIDFLNKQESLHPNDPEWVSELYNMDNFHYIIAEYDRYSYEDARQVTIEHALTLI